MDKAIKTYKGFNKDMSCTPPNTNIKFSYEEGKEYETEHALACSCGFHGCEMPFDTFKYYQPSKSIYHEVEQSGEISRDSGDSKIASTKIKIGAKIGIRGLVKRNHFRRLVKRSRFKPQCDCISLWKERRAKGVIGSYIVLTEWNDDADTLISAKMVEIDGENYKPDTWYKMKNGEIIECSGEDD